MKKYILIALISLLCMNFPFKCSATNIDEDYEISFIDRDNVTIVKNHYIEIEGERYKLGESIVSSFWNTEDGRNNLSGNISGSLLSSILSFWDSSASVVQTDIGIAPLSFSESQEEISVNESKQIDNLSKNSVRFWVTKKIDIDGTTYNLGDPKLVSYENSLEGRQSLVEEIGEPFYSLIMAAWGDTPTVIPENTESSIDERVDAQTTEKIDISVIGKV
ncbi:MAG: hypothetical protein ACI4PR_02585 [Acutalibacteraceae bacterium]